MIDLRIPGSGKAKESYCESSKIPHYDTMSCAKCTVCICLHVFLKKRSFWMLNYYSSGKVHGTVPTYCFFMGPLLTYLFWGCAMYLYHKVYHCLFVLSDLCWCHLASSLSANCLQVWGAICSRDGLGPCGTRRNPLPGPVFSAGSFRWSCVEFCGWTSQHNLTRRVGVVFFFFLGRKVYDLKKYMFFSGIFGWLDGKHILKFTQ